MGGFGQSVAFSSSPPGFRIYSRPNISTSRKGSSRVYYGDSNGVEFEGGGISTAGIDEAGITDGTKGAVLQGQRVGERMDAALGARDWNDLPIISPNLMPLGMVSGL